jgi:transcription factor IIIB subunit 2
MQLDWLSYGRRPQSLCGAAIIIASNLEQINLTTKEVSKKIFVCEETLKKRLQEF